MVELQMEQQFPPGFQHALTFQMQEVTASDTLKLSGRGIG